MKEPFIRIGDEGEVIERGGWEPEVNNTPDSEDNNTPAPDIIPHDFEKDTIERRTDIVFIIDNPFVKLPN